MKAKIKAGAEIDFLSSDEFKAGVDKLAAAIEKLQLRPVQRRRLSGTATADASGNASINLGTVPQGRQWNVRIVRTTGPTAAVINGHSVIYRNEAQPSAYVDSTNKAGTTSASGLPNVSDAGSNERIFAAGEILLVTFFGCAASQVVYANADVIDEPADTLETDIGVV